MPAWVVPAIVAAGQVISTALQNRSAKKRQEEMNDYNKPKAQMSRYKEAGLNPNLMYSQGNPGNQSSPVPVKSYEGALGAVDAYNQTRMVTSQVAAKDAQTVKTQVETQVSEIQKQLLQANPLLNNEGFQATLSILKNTAYIKENEADISMRQTEALKEISSKRRTDANGLPTHYSNAAEKVLKEIDILEQRFQLNNQDAKIKAQILSGKEFQNAILEVQKRFMTDFDLTPQNWLQFVTLLLQRAF